MKTPTYARQLAEIPLSLAWQRLKQKLTKVMHQHDTNVQNQKVIHSNFFDETKLKINQKLNHLTNLRWVSTGRMMLVTAATHTGQGGRMLYFCLRASSMSRRCLPGQVVPLLTGHEKIFQ